MFLIKEIATAGTEKITKISRFSQAFFISLCDAASLWPILCSHVVRFDLDDEPIKYLPIIEVSS